MSWPYIGSSWASHGAAASTASKSASAPCSHPGTKSAQASSPSFVRVARSRLPPSIQGAPPSSNDGCQTADDTRTSIREQMFVTPDRDRIPAPSPPDPTLEPAGRSCT
jgi:hypothetical protein